MATENIEDLSDDEIEARQRAEDGEDESHNPTQDDADPEAAPETEGAEKTPDEPAKEGEPEAAASAAAPDKAAAAQAAGAEPGKPAGVLSKDGDRVLPYEALRAERRSARAAAARAERAEKEAETLKQQLDDLRAGKTPEPSKELTEDDVKYMEENFPEEGAKLRAAYDRIQDLQAKVPKADASKDADADDPTEAVQEAIDQVPLLLDWQHQDPEKFTRAVEHDALLLKSPKWKERPALDRFIEATRRTADEFDIAFEPPPKPKTSTTAKPAAAPAPVPASRKPPETLSDFKGGSVADHGSIDTQRMTPVALLDRFAGMTDEQIDAHLAKYG